MNLKKIQKLLDRKTIGLVYIVLGILFLISVLPITPLYYLKTNLISFIQEQSIFLFVTILLSLTWVFLTSIKDLVIGRKAWKLVTTYIILFEFVLAFLIFLLYSVTFGLFFGVYSTNYDQYDVTSIFGDPTYSLIVYAGAYLIVIGIFKIENLAEKFLEDAKNSEKQIYY